MQFKRSRAGHCAKENSLPFRRPPGCSCLSTPRFRGERAERSSQDGCINRRVNAHRRELPEGKGTAALEGVVSPNDGVPSRRHRMRWARAFRPEKPCWAGSRQLLPWYTIQSSEPLGGGKRTVSDGADGSLSAYVGRKDGGKMAFSSSKGQEARRRCVLGAPVRSVEWRYGQPNTR